MKYLLISSVFVLSVSASAHWRSPDSIFPNKEEVVPDEMRKPSSLHVKKIEPKKTSSKEKSTKDNDDRMN